MSHELVLPKQPLPRNIVCPLAGVPVYEATLWPVSRAFHSRPTVIFVYPFRTLNFLCHTTKRSGSSHFARQNSLFIQRKVNANWQPMRMNADCLQTFLIKVNNNKFNRRRKTNVSRNSLQIERFVPQTIIPVVYAAARQASTQHSMTFGSSIGTHSISCHNRQLEYKYCWRAALAATFVAIRQTQRSAMKEREKCQSVCLSLAIIVWLLVRQCFFVIQLQMCCECDQVKLCAHDIRLNSGQRHRARGREEAPFNSRALCT